MQRDTPWAPGTPSWVDLMTTDLPAAIEFYTALFGWDFAPGPPEFGGYGNASIDGRKVCGLTPMMTEGQPSTWTTYLASADAEATGERITAAGGSLIAPPMDVMDLGRMAVAQAPDGGTFGVWQAGTHLGCELANEPGAPAWNEYLAGDYAAARAFYAEVFGYGITDVGNDEYQYSMFEIDGNVVGGIGRPGDGGSAPYWRTYFAVVDTDATLKRGGELGGTVVVAGQDSPFGRWGTLADPQGAEFSMIALTPPG